MIKCLDCGNTEYFRELYHDWSLIQRSDDGTYGIAESLSFGEACDPAHPMECHDCNKLIASRNAENPDVQRLVLISRYIRQAATFCHFFASKIQGTVN